VIADLSYEITAGLVTYPGLAAPEVRTVVTREETGARLSDSVSFEVQSVTMVGNTGTYMDAPFHYHAGLTALPAPVAGMASFPVRAVATWPS